MQQSSLHARRTCLALLVLMILILTACQPKITVSTDSKDTDFSKIHLDAISGEGFSVEPDVRVFTLFAYLNGVAGYDQENGKSMTSERVELREALKERLAKADPQAVKRWQSFYNGHKRHAYQYLYYTLALGAPPEFNYVVPMAEIKEAGIMRDLDGFNRILAEFYTGAGLEELYTTRFREQMLEGVRAYNAEQISQQVDSVYQYLRLDRAQYGTFDVVIVPIPYETHYSAYSIGFTKRLYIVDGPGSNDTGLNVHEYLHMLMDAQIPADLAGEKGKFDAILKANWDAQYVKDGYRQVNTFVEECLVRALDYRIRVTAQPGWESNAKATIQDEVAGGLVLVDDFYLALQAYEKDSGQDFKGFVIEALKGIAEK